MTWRISSKEGAERWLESSSGVDFTADPETTAELADLPSYRYPLTPTGPIQIGVRTPSELFGAAWRLIPSPVVEGDHPDYPNVATKEGVIY